LPQEWAIKAHDFVKTFGTARAVDGVDLLVETGTVYGVLGPNGAGKTATIRMLATLLRADSGTATIFGHNVFTEPQADRCPQLASSPSPSTNPTFRPSMSVVAA
jgi:ABC-type multidrug transport system ATPase subunit